MDNIYKNKKVLVAGGTGMIGRQLVDMILSKGAEVRISSLDNEDRANPKAEFIKANLTEYEECLKVCKGMDYVFNLTGVKGSPLLCMKNPASFFEPTIFLSLNMLKAAHNSGVERYLYTSSVGVYAPSEVFNEDDVWQTMPSKNDWFAAWAKRMGELQVEAYKTEYGWDKIAIVRPANVYGPFDNFSPENSMVIPSLIRRAVNGENPFVVWGDGSQIRDFIHCKDVARGMLAVMEKMPSKPVNLGSGKGVRIKEIVESICDYLGNNLDIQYDTTKPQGDKQRLMNVESAESLGIVSQVSIKEGIAETIEWYKENRYTADDRYDVFSASK